MNHKRLLPQMTGLTLVLLFLVACGTPQPTPTPVPPTATPTPVPPTATIIDTGGKAYEVWNLRAQYYNRHWIPAKKRSKKSLTIVLHFEEDRVSTYKELEFPFASMRRFVYAAEDCVPEEIKEVFEGEGMPSLIEMKDDSLILVSIKLLVEIDSNGNQKITRPVRIDKFKLDASTSYWLDRFIGRAKTKSGEMGDFWIERSEVMGDFWIDKSEVRSIEFE